MAMVYNKFVFADDFKHHWESKGAVVTRTGDLFSVAICGGVFEQHIVDIVGMAEIIPVSGNAYDFAEDFGSIDVEE